MTSLLFLKSVLFATAMQKKKRRKKMKFAARKSNCTELCRICNEVRADIPIFDNMNHINISEEIKKISGVIIHKYDKYSKYICQNCVDLLQGCILFRDMCHKSNKRCMEMSIKKEHVSNEDKIGELNAESEESFNIPSPTYSNENPDLWVCSSCNKEFLDMTSYNTHLDECNTLNRGNSKVERNKKFLCDICGKTSKSNANLLIHMGIHENVFPYKCDVCPYKGRTMDLLKVHKRTHMTDKPFKCTQCPKSTTTSSNLNKHMQHVHSKSRPYKCTYCEKSFSTKHDMQKHIKDIHLRQGTVECEICYKKFNTKKILQGHRWKIHKIKGLRHGRLPSYLQCQTGAEVNSETRTMVISDNSNIPDNY